jgi:hypothetical protein
MPSAPVRCSSEYSYSVFFHGAGSGSVAFQSNHTQSSSFTEPTPSLCLPKEPAVGLCSRRWLRGSCPEHLRSVFGDHYACCVFPPSACTQSSAPTEGSLGSRSVSMPRPKAAELWTCAFPLFSQWVHRVFVFHEARSVSVPFESTYTESSVTVSGLPRSVPFSKWLHPVLGSYGGLRFSFSIPCLTELQEYFQSRCTESSSFPEPASPSLPKVSTPSLLSRWRLRLRLRDLSKHLHSVFGLYSAL